MPTAPRHPESIPGPARATYQDVLDARLLDHFVVGDGEVVSFSERGWL